ncbi:MBL fold metallo-hydrolase [Fusobacterium polymorphum]|uniref:MBL fold metallo-hydrolase n=1 Tax=Fusobacterium nucleatum subsp. polymorphum TaxID=76857 RepID=UPI00292217A2|nr:MBL fold metallo-hydrolase [Fusobacterium nucleatum]BEP09398.1 MBL fold metallo-hydrolase [Fusobacterium nucleatum]
MVYYIYHSAFVIELKKSILIFDFYRFPSNKKKEKEEFFNRFIKRTDKKVYVFSTHSHSDHFNKEILTWLEMNENIKYILSDDIKIHKDKNFYFTKEDDSFELDNLKITTFGSTDLGSSFYVNTEDKNIFHSGDLHFWHWEDDTAEEEKNMYDGYIAQLEKIKKLDRIDIAFVPVDPRLGVNTLEGVELFYKILKPKIIIPMHFSDDYSRMKEFTEKFKYNEDVKVIEIEDSMEKVLE